MSELRGKSPFWGTRKEDIDGAACGGDTPCGQGSVRNRRGYGSHTAVTGPEQGSMAWVWLWHPPCYVFAKWFSRLSSSGSRFLY